MTGPEGMPTPEVRPQTELLQRGAFLTAWETTMKSLRQGLEVPQGERKAGLFADSWQETDERFSSLVKDQTKKGLLEPLGESRDRVLAWRRAANVAEALNCSRQGKREEAQAVLAQIEEFKTNTPEELELWYKNPPTGDPLEINFDPQTLAFEGLLDPDGQPRPEINLRPTELALALEEIGNSKSLDFLKKHTVFSVSTEINPAQELSYAEFEKLLEEKIKTEVGDEVYQKMLLGEKLGRRFGAEKTLWENGQITGFKFICAAEPAKTTPSASTTPETSLELDPMVDINKKIDQVLTSQIEKTLAGAVRGNKEIDQEAVQESWAMLLYRSMDLTPDNAKAVIALKLLQVSGKTDFKLAPEEMPALDLDAKTEQQFQLRGQLADFVEVKLKQAGSELTPQERQLLANDQFKAGRLLTALNEDQILKVMREGRLEALTGQLPPEMQAAFVSLAEKFKNTDVVSLINQSLFGNFRPEAILAEAKETWGKEIEKVQPGFWERQGQRIKNLPAEIKKNRLMLILLLAQGQSFFTGLLTKMLPEEGR